MKNSSGTVNTIDTNQEGIHESLNATVEKYAATGFRKPVAAHTQRAFDKVQAIIEKQSKPIILDSGCGTAMSTRVIANKYPDALVIGVDRSITRLQKQVEECLPSNAISIQADLVDFWRLATQAQWKLQRHFILYPNPYPKASQLNRRWHGHPVFQNIIKLGGQLEIRTNWKIYADEFVSALEISGYPDGQIDVFIPNDYWTLFEKKYHESEQELYRYCIELT